MKFRIFVDDREKERRRSVTDNVTRVLAEYPNSLLVEVDETQVDKLKALGFTFAEEKKPMIKLRVVEFDPDELVPEPPPTFMLGAAELREMKKVYWILQFVGPIKAEWAEEIKSLNVTLHSYIPENAYLAEMTTATKEKVADLDYVKWVGLYEPVYKVSPALVGKRKKIAPSAMPSLSIAVAEHVAKPEGNITVILHDSKDMEAVSEKITKLGGKIIVKGKDRIRASLDPERINELAKATEVNFIEPYVEPSLANNVADGIINVKNVWDNHGLDGEGQTIAVADTGLDSGVNDASMHDDFKGRILSIHDRVGDGADDANSGHGTHVAGSVLGNGSRSMNGIRGMAYSANLIFQALENKSNGLLSGIPSDLNDLFQEAYNDRVVNGVTVKGARIHTNSWGSAMYGYYSNHSNDVDEFVWNNKDMVILFCAHNFGVDSDSNGVVDPDSVCTQGCAKNCITVGASENNRTSGGYNFGGVCDRWGSCWPLNFPADPINSDRISDNPEGMAAFSGRGPSDDDRIKPDIVAPGTNILSTRSSVATGTGWGELPPADPKNPHYLYMGGTSMATPITAGAVALIRQYLEKVLLLNPSAALVKAALIHGAHSMAGQYTDPNKSDVGPIPDINQGWGRVDLVGSLFRDFPVKYEFIDDMNDELETGDYREFDFDVVTLTEPFKATLVWSDYPASVTTGGLVNQLSLSVIHPDGSVTYGPPNYPSIENNVQQVTINNPQIGKYKVRVDAISIATFVSPLAVIIRRQNFALAVSGGLEYVDLYIKDNGNDSGMEPSTGQLIYSPDIWVSGTDDPNAGSVKAKPGEKNYVFVRVHNRGTHPAEQAEVKLYWASAASCDVGNWGTTGIQVDGVPGNLRHIDVAAHGATGDGTTVTQSFEWVPAEKKNYNLYATVHHSMDPLIQEDDEVVRWEDNLAKRNMNLSVAQKNCVVATLASGSILGLPVQYLRKYREDVVLKSRFKAPFNHLLKLYYGFSPKVVHCIKRSPRLGSLIKYGLVLPFVYTAKIIVQLMIWGAGAPRKWSTLLFSHVFT